MKNFTSRKESLIICAIIFATFIVGGMVPSIAHAADKKPVKIGILAPFSPPGAVSLAKREKWGAELAIKYINEEMGGVLGGRPVELVAEDDSGTPSEGIAGFRKLAQKDKVVGVVGQCHSSVMIAVTKLAKDLGVPIFSTGASSPKITESQHPTTFSIMSLTPDRAEFWMDFAKQMGWNRVAMVTEDTDYGTGFEKWVKIHGEKLGIEVKSIVLPRTMADMTPALLEIKAWKPDATINAFVGAPCYLMVKQANDVGLFPQVPMVGSYDFPVRPEYWDAVGDAGKYILFTSYYKPGMLVTELGEWMIPKYKELYNEEPTFYALNAYGQVLIIAQAVNMAQSDDPRDVTEALIRWPYMDWSGTVDFKEPEGMKWHNVTPPHLILQMTAVRQPFAETKLVWPRQFGGDGKFLTP